VLGAGQSGLVESEPMVIFCSTQKRCEIVAVWCITVACLENLEMSGNYTDVREMSGISLKVMEMSENCQGKNLVMENCCCGWHWFLFIYEVIVIEYELDSLIIDFNTV